MGAELDKLMVGIVISIAIIAGIVGTFIVTAANYDVTISNDCDFDYSTLAGTSAEFREATNSTGAGTDITDSKGIIAIAAGLLGLDSIDLAKDSIECVGNKYGMGSSPTTATTSGMPFVYILMVCAIILGVFALGRITIFK